MTEREIIAWKLRVKGMTYREVGEHFKITAGSARILAQRGGRCMDSARKHLPATIAPIDATYDQIMVARQTETIEYFRGEVYRLTSRNARLEERMAQCK